MNYNDLTYLDQFYIEQTSTPEGAMIRARAAVSDLLYHRYGTSRTPHAPGDPFGGTTQLEQVLAEIHGTFEDVEA